MSEQNEILTGKDSIEHAQGYVSMPETAPVAAEAPINLGEAVEQRTVREANNVIDVGYQQANPDGTRSDRPSPPNQTLSAERAAEDLANWRRGIGETVEALKDQALKEQIESGRSPLAKEIKEGKQETEAAFDRGYEFAQAQQQEQQPQAEQAQAQPVDQDLSRILQENPRLMQAINEQRQQDWQQATQTVAAAEQWIHDSAGQAIAGVMVNFPELQGIPLAHLPTALGMMQKTNPERHAQAMKYIGAVQGIINQSAQLHQQQQQYAERQYQQQWNRFQADEDAKFIQRNPQMADPAQAGQITQKAISYLRNIGFSDQDLGAIWHGQASLSGRDHRVQQLIMDAMSFRAARDAVPNARVNKPVRVQQPGARGQIATQEDSDLRSLSQRLTNASGRDTIKAAAELLAARRARR